MVKLKHDRVGLSTINTGMVCKVNKNTRRLFMPDMPIPCQDYPLMFIKMP